MAVNIFGFRRTANTTPSTTRQSCSRQWTAGGLVSEPSHPSHGRALATGAELTPSPFGPFRWAAEVRQNSVQDESGCYVSPVADLRLALAETANAVLWCALVHLFLDMQVQALMCCALVSQRKICLKRKEPESLSF